MELGVIKGEKPCGTWRTVREDVGIRNGRTWTGVDKLVRDRERWKGLSSVSGPYPEPG